MSQQIQITGGAKVRDLQDVIIGTSGVLSSLAFNVANGVPKLDSGGKILVSQLPNSVMEYKGTWNAATNTPTLVNGTGNQGDVYLCNVAGTVDFGAGAIAFVIGDQVIYSGSIWQRASGATGTVTSVAVTESGDSLNITGSPITTSGTINIGFNGTNLQYVNGAGNLTTFPTLMTSVGLTMPSAFTVTNSPLTGAGGTLAVTGAGTTAQYIRGDGSLATFPTIASEAQRLITEVYNSTGATLTKGTVVYINGGQGNLPTVTKAIATGDATSAQTYGIVQTDITNMNNGYVVVVGSLMDLDTQAYAAGTQLYLSSTTAGAWTSVKQYAPAHLVYVGIVVRSHPTQGVVEVRIQNGFEMDELHNVSAQTPSNNQGLFYNSSTSLWENKSIATALGYTPANDALVVHLTGNETIGGTKTFSDATKNNGGIFLQNASSSSLAGYMNLGGLTNGVKFTSGGGISNTFTLPSATGYTFTFPNATGTLALTSDLSGYLPLTGGTLTGSLTLPSNTASGNPALYFNYGANAASRSWRLCNDVESFGDFKIQQSTTQTGSTYADILKFTPTGGALFTSSVTLTGALSGTSASFSSSVSASDFISTSNVTGAALRLLGGGTSTMYQKWGNDGGNYFIGISSSTGTGLLGGQTAYSFCLVTESARDMSFGTSNTERMRITSGGNVGIGTSSPANTLDVQTSSGVGSSTASGLARFITAGTTPAISIGQASNARRMDLYSFVINVTGEEFNLTTIDSQPIKFNTAATLRMIITGSGNVGIGTSSPSVPLNVISAYSAGTTTTSLKLATVGGYNAGSGTSLDFGQDQGSYSTWLTGRISSPRTGSNWGGSLAFFTNDDSSATALVERMRITSGGNVGIGTSSPSGTDVTLNVRGISGKTVGMVVAESYDAGSMVSLYSGSSSGDDPSLIYLKNLRFGSGNKDTSSYVERMRITSGGNVLIGTTTDGGTHKLQVNGSIIATGFFESSDIRLKTLIQDNYQTKGIASITPKLYTKNGKVELGYYAQDFVGILDSAVSKGSDDMLSLSYREVLVAKVYALEQRIKELENK